jgi:hypothetical protein
MGEKEAIVPPRPDQQWRIVGRWQEYEGELRANLLRIAGIGLFYVIELLNYYGLSLGPIEMPKVVGLPFHQSVTALAVAWTAVCLGVLLCLKMRVFPAGLKYFSTACDVLFLTGILMAADGPRSPLAIGYFLVIVVSTLRFSLPLVRFAALGSMAGYLWLLAYARWFTERDLRVPRYQQAIFLLGLALAGVVLGQAIRRVEGLARDYAARLDSRKGGQP